MSSNVLANGARIMGIPVIAVVGGYVVISMAAPGWPISTPAQVALFVFGVVCCGWAAYRARAVAAARFWVAACFALAVSVVHFLIREGLHSAALTQGTSTSLPYISASIIGIIYTAPITVFVTWVAVVLANRKRGTMTSNNALEADREA